MGYHILMKLVVITIFAYAFVPPVQSLPAIFGNNLKNQNNPSSEEMEARVVPKTEPQEKKPNFGGARKMDTETAEIQPGAKYKRARRQIQNSSQSNELEGYFLDGCSKSDYKASIQYELEKLLLKNEDKKLDYVQQVFEKKVLKKQELEKKEADGNMQELKNLENILTETKNNITTQLEKLWINANVTIDGKKKMLNETRKNVTNSESEANTIKSQIKKNDNDTTALQLDFDAIKQQKEDAEKMRNEQNILADSCESKYSFMGIPFDIQKIKERKNIELQSIESNLAGTLQSKDNQKNCCLDKGC